MRKEKRKLGYQREGTETCRKQTPSAPKMKQKQKGNRNQEK